MQKYDIVIIGSGLGGLMCAYTLAQEGYNVCVLEKHSIIGGNMQIFKRNGCIFNTGLNYTESLDKDQILYKYFKYFNLIDNIKLKRLDQDGFDIINFANDKQEYPIAIGYDNFIEQLAKIFPKQRQNLKNYIEKISEVASSFPLFNIDKKKDLTPIFLNKTLSLSAYKFIEETITDEKLRNVIAGNSMLYAGDREKTPLYMHSIINHSFIASAYRIVDGSQQIADQLAKSIINFGGTIKKRAEVKKIIVENKIASKIVLSSGEEIAAEYIVSNIHPANTLDMIEEDKIGKIYRSRIKELENTIGMFSLYIVFKENTFPYINKNFYYHQLDNMWNATKYKENEFPIGLLFYTPAVSKSDKWADCAIAMTYMNFNEVKKWENTTINKRGQEYLDFKQIKAEQLIDKIEKLFPDIRKNIDKYYTSTPLTYRDYTGTPNGSAYGIIKDYDNILQTTIMPKTKIKNLLLTGQNINMHGILGVTINSILTSAEIIGLDKIIDKIKKAN